MGDNWMTALVQTYDTCEKDPRTKTGNVPLVPVYHTLCNAYITVTIDGNGNFITAEIVPRGQQNTQIPCTESSANRTNVPSPHPLDEELKYLIPHINLYLHKHTKSDQDPYGMYLDLLERWCAFDPDNTKIEAILTYIRKGTLLKDLITNEIVTVNANGSIAEKTEMPNSPLFAISSIKEQEKALVRWTVDIPEDHIKDTWRDENVINSWIKFAQSLESNQGLCYISGKVTFLAIKHPHRIRNAGDQAKIISSNDDTNTRFTGRFENAQQAYGIGSISTQKAHSALRWLINKQGYTLGNLCVLVWNSDNHRINNPTDDFSQILEFKNDTPIAQTKEEVARHLNNRLRGYNSEVLDKEVNMLVLDSASTKGRMSIVTFRKTLGGDLIANLEHWHESCAWIHRYAMVKDENDKQREITFVGAPSPKDIAQATYGQKADDDLLAHTVKRLLPCIIDGSTIPADLVSSIVRRASMPQSMAKAEWKKTMSIACSVYKQFTGGMYEMTLEKERRSRDYLYGRLLAVADLMEESALKKANESRQTTAIRFMQRFSEFPYTTWKSIELALIPYGSRLGPKLASYYQGKIAEIMELFDGDDFRNDKALSGEFLLAYHCQRNDQFTRKETDEDKETEE